MSGKPNWGIALGVLGLVGLSLAGCGPGQSQFDALNAQRAKCEDDLAQVNDKVAALQQGRSNVLTVSFQPSTFMLSPIPFVPPGKDLQVEVDWSNNPDGWESVVLDHFTDIDGNQISTDPPTLELTMGNPTGQIRVLGKGRPYVHYQISYTRTVGKKSETWTIDPDWERWP